MSRVNPFIDYRLEEEEPPKRASHQEALCQRRVGKQSSSPDTAIRRKQGMR